MIMDLTPIYIAISIIVLLIIFVIVFFVRKNKKQKRVSVLAGLAFVFVIAGIFFSDDRLIGYSLFGVGVSLAVLDIIMKLTKK